MTIVPDLSLSVYSGLASGCKNYKNMKYLIAGTWGLMLENEIQNKISSIRSYNKEDAYKLLNAYMKSSQTCSRKTYMPLVYPYKNVRNAKGQFLQ